MCTACMMITCCVLRQTTQPFAQILLRINPDAGQVPDTQVSNPQRATKSNDCISSCNQHNITNLFITRQQPLTCSQGWSLLKSAAVNASIHILRRAYALDPCQQTPVSLLTDSSVTLTPTNCAFFVRILRDQAAILSAPHVYPEPPELAGVLLALRRSEVGGKRGWVVAMYDEVVCR